MSEFNNNNEHDDIKISPVLNIGSQNHTDVVGGHFRMDSLMVPDDSEMREQEQIKHQETISSDDLMNMVKPEEPVAESDDAPESAPEDEEEDILRNDPETMTPEELHQYRLRTLEFIKSSGLTVPMSHRHKHIATSNTLVDTMSHADLRKSFNTPGSQAYEQYQAITHASPAMEFECDSLGKVGSTPEEMAAKLKTSVGGVGDAATNTSALFQNRNTFDIKGKSGALIVSALLGGLRRVVLWNSGITITLRPLTTATLNAFYNETHRDSYEFGRAHGMPFYYFEDVEISRAIIEDLLPEAICDSNYVGWRSTDKLMKVIAWQDFPTILWAMATMMHPTGVNVRFACGNNDCGYVHSEKVDLTKIHLVNSDLITDEMIAHFKKKTVNDDDLAEYAKHCYRDTIREFSYLSNDGTTRKWSVEFKPSTVDAHLAMAKSFITDLEKVAKLTDNKQIVNYVNLRRVSGFKDWIKSMALTIIDETNPADRGHTVNIDCDEQSGANTMDVVLDDFMVNYPEFITVVNDWIASTSINHFAFMMKECPQCHTTPDNSRGGYIPYDVMRAFFTQTQISLFSGRLSLLTKSTYDSMNIS